MSKEWMILLLVAALLAIGFAAGWLWARWWYTSEDEAIEGIVLPLEPRPVQMDDFWDDHVSNLELLTVVPESVSRPGASDGRIAEASGLAAMPDALAGPGHTTSTWLMERRLWMDAHYPIPAGA